MKKSNQPSFRAVQKEWYEKLKKDGFKDAEEVFKEEHRLKIFDSCQFNRERVRNVFQFKQDYYLMAEKFLNLYKFDNQMERTIWEMHSNGVSIRSISSSWKSGKAPNKDSVNRIIRRLAALMLRGTNE